MNLPTSPPILEARKTLRLGFLSVAVFSGVINVLMLASPIYSLQIFDKVLTSYSLPTLVALTVLFGMLTLAFGLMDAVRSKLLLRMGHLFDRLYAPIALDYQLSLLRSDRQGQPVKALDDLQEIRSTLNAQVLPALLDAPWVPLFLLIVFIIHPWLGVVSLIGAILHRHFCWFGARRPHAGPLWPRPRARPRPVPACARWRVARTRLRHSVFSIACIAAGLTAAPRHGVHNSRPAAMSRRCRPRLRPCGSCSRWRSTAWGRGS